MPSPARHSYEFDQFTLDVGERRLLRAGRPVRLTPEEFDTLLALVRGAGRVMTKEELLKEIWPDTLVGEATLAQNVFTLRRALGEAGGATVYVETVPRRGYRFAVSVTEQRESAAPHLTRAPESRTDHASSPRTSSTFAREAYDQPVGGHPVRAAVLIALLLFLSVAALVYAVFRLSVRPDVERPPSFHSMKVKRLPLTGAFTEAVISPSCLPMSPQHSVPSPSPRPPG